MPTMPHCLQWSANLFSPAHCDRVTDTAEAAFLLRKNKKDVVWNTLRNFEGMPITLPQTEVILNGFSVDGLSVRDLLKVKHFGDAVDGLCDLVEEDAFALEKSVLCSLHSAAAKDEVRERGMFRRRNVALNRVAYAPPDALLLDERWSDGVDLVNDIENPLERACVAFLFMARTQFFEDCNKRTALLVMNGLLMTAGLRPFFMPQSDQAKFILNLSRFYETGEADSMLLLMRDYAAPQKNLINLWEKAMTCSADLTDYGKITLLAVKKLGEENSPKNAWESAVETIKGKPSKPCARAAFIGLCLAGIVKGSPERPAKFTTKNRDYAIKGLQHLQRHPEHQSLKPSELWKAIPITYPAKQSGYQMDIAIALFVHDLVDMRRLAMFA